MKIYTWDNLTHEFDDFEIPTALFIKPGGQPRTVPEFWVEVSLSFSQWLTKITGEPILEAYAGKLEYSCHNYAIFEWSLESGEYKIIYSADEMKDPEAILRRHE